MSERLVTVGGNRATRPIEDLQLLPKPLEWFVGPNATDDGDDGRSGKSKGTSLATLDAAIDLAVANTDSQNDIIHVLPGHAETVSSAGMINLDKIGLRVICHGTGALRPTFTFSDVDATILLSAASTSMTNFIVIPSVDSVVSGIVVSAANCTVDFEVQDAANVEFITALLTTAAADKLTVNMKYIGDVATGDACVAPIQLVGVNSAKINVDFYGIASTAVVNFITTACTDIDVKGYFHNVGTALTKSVVDTEGNGSWSVSGWDGVNNAHFSGGDNATIASDDVTAVTSELAKVPKSDSNVSFNATALQAIQDEVEDALEGEDLDHLVKLDSDTQPYPVNCAADSIMAKALCKGDPATPSSYDCTTDSQEMISDKLGGFSGDGGAAADDSAKAILDLLVADITGAVDEPPVAKSLHDILHKDGSYTFDNTTDSLEAIRDFIAAGITLAADAITAAKVGDDAFSEEHFDGDAVQAMTMGKKVSKATATLAGTSTVDLFTVATGRVVVHAIVGEVTTVVQGQTTSCKLISTPTTGTAVDLCAALDLTGDEVGCLYGITGLFSDALVGSDAGATVSLRNPIIVPIGVIGFNNASAANTGSVKWDIYYTPLDTGATIVSA